MKNISKTKLLVKYLDLEIKGFERINFDDDFIDTYYGNLYQRKKENVVEILQFKIQENKVGASGWIIHEAVEDVLNIVLLKKNIPKTLHKEDKVKTILNKEPITEEVKQILNSLNKITLESEANIITSSHLLMEYIEKSLVPFWNKFSSLKMINDDIINIVPQLELSKYIPSHTPLKKLIIMKLCGNEKYKEYSDWMDETYQRMIINNPQQYEAQYQIYKELQNLLSNVKPS